MASQLSQRNHPIRPAPPREILSSRLGAAGSFSASPVVVPAKRRGPQTTLACDACRTRKTKCDGLRPCEACRAKSLQCHYDKEGREKNKTSVLRGQIADLRAIVKRFSDASDEEASEMRKRLKESQDLSRVVKDFCSSSGSFDYSETERSESPDSMSTSTTSSSQRLPSIDFLPNVNSKEADQTRTPTKLELFKIARRRAMVDTISTDPNDEHGELSFSISIPTTSHFPSTFQQIPLIRRSNVRFGNAFQFKANKTEIPFLSIHPLSRMPVSDISISRLACLWLSYHAFSNPYIQPTTLISSFDSACGSFSDDQLMLQNAVLALSCLYLPKSERFEYSEPLILAQHFHSEVERLWRSQRGFVSVPTIQALLAQYEFEKLSGRDRCGWHSLNSAVAMSQEIGLHSIHTSQDDDYNIELETFAAWGVFNHQAIESLIYCRPPQVLRCWTERPNKIFPSRITDSWQAFGISEEAMNSSFWDHWEALCSLCDIIVDATYVLHGEQVDGFEVPGNVLVAQTQHSRWRLHDWRQNLPDTLSLSTNESPHNLWLHMAYYATTISLHRPYTTCPSLASNESRDVVLHARTVMIEASRSIVRLAAISFDLYTMELTAAHVVSMLGVAAFVLVRDLADTESRADLLDAIAMLRLLGQSRGLVLAMALARALLLVAEKSLETTAATATHTTLHSISIPSVPTLKPGSLAAADIERALNLYEDLRDFPLNATASGSPTNPTNLVDGRFDPRDPRTRTQAQPQPQAPRVCSAFPSFLTIIGPTATTTTASQSQSQRGDSTRTQELQRRSGGCTLSELLNLLC